MASADFERKLVRALYEYGMVAMRAPSSGSATKRELPDVLAGQAVIMGPDHGPTKRYSDCMAIELKTISGTTAYVEEGEVEKLRKFAREWGATPYLGGKFKRPGGSRSKIYLIKPEDCRITEGNRYGIPEADAHDRAEMVVLPATESKPAEVIHV